jgi:molybdopterin molybdotransferase
MSLLSVTEVDDRLARLHLSLNTVRLPLADASGLLLQEDVLTDRDVPPFDRVMMDGYAMRASDFLSDSSFTVTGEALAGAPQVTLQNSPQAAITVMTGAPLPTGADTVVRIEDTVRDGDRITFTGTEFPSRGQFIHPTGSDAQKGDILLRRGCRMRSAEIGIAASAGCTELMVTRPIRIGVVGTGDELVEIGTQPLPHQIRRSNALAIATALKTLPVQISPLEHLGDNPEEDGKRLRQIIANHDVIILTGAVSKGRLDWIPAALDTIADNQFHGVAQRPGKPMGVWKSTDNSVIFALPGNPVSAIVGVHRHVLPWLATQLSQSHACQMIALGKDFTSSGDLTRFVPVKIGPTGRATEVKMNNSGDYAALAGSDGFIELSAKQNRWTSGTSVPFYPWV